MYFQLFLLKFLPRPVKRRSFSPSTVNMVGEGRVTDDGIYIS